MIAAGTVLVNGIIEKQKRKKMVVGDTIEMNG
ncbi:MAG: RNA-binding S4 domain-containing protein [Gammaproteobacteria bacterium]|nr:RNA-binding S4 domain-containing protein [Gammaproteobacteria bacterium]MCH9763813.1 RNA-binding S4 domain-containing protein [Gammaproteobacteria bacterium]